MTGAPHKQKENILADTKNTKTKDLTFSAHTKEGLSKHREHKGKICFRLGDVRKNVTNLE